MLKIAICDNDKNICSGLENIIINHFKTSKSKFETETFYSGEELISFLSDGIFFDIIFLDIEMYEVNGVEVGKRIRNDMRNFSTEIVYVSGTTKYDRQLFAVQPLGFISKPIQKVDVIDSINLMIERSSRFGGLFKYKKEKNSLSIPFEDIIYFQSNGRKLSVITADATDQFYGKMDDLIMEISTSTFRRINRSTMININHIRCQKFSEVIMSNNHTLSISKTYKEEMRSFLLSEA